MGAELGNLKPNAARMRFYRLRESIEGVEGGLDGADNNDGNGNGVATKDSASKANSKGNGGKKRKLKHNQSSVEDATSGGKVKTEDN